MSWIIDHLPWWAWVIAGGAVLAATVTFWLPIWTALPRSAKAGLIAIGGIFAAYFAGRNRGASNATDAQRGKDAKALKQRLEVEDEIRGMSKSDRDRLVDGWMRDKPK